MSSSWEQFAFFSCFYSVHIFLSESSETLSPVLMGGGSGYPFLSGIHRECSDPYCKFATYSLYSCWQCSIWLLVPSILFIMKHIKPSGVFLYQGEHVYLCDWSYLLVCICGTNLGSLGCNQLVMMFLIFLFVCFYLKTKSLMCTSCLPACVYMHRVCVAPLEDRIGYQTLWNQS